MQRSSGEGHDIIRHHPSFMLILVYRVVFGGGNMQISDYYPDVPLL